MENPTTVMHDAPMSGLANLMAMKGRENDSMLVHLSPSEVSNLNKLSGNTMTINPATGLPEGRSRLLEAVLPALLSIGVGIATGGTSIPAQMAAMGAAGYGGQRLVGRGHDEALTSGLISAATAGLLGGTGSEVLKGAGKEATKKAGEEAIKQAATQAVTKDTIFRGGAEAARKIAEETAAQKAIELASQNLTTGGIGTIAKTAFVPQRDLYSAINTMGFGEAIKQPSIQLGLATQTAGQAGLNAMVDQMRADANRPRDLSRPPTATGELWTQPYNMELQGPYSQQDITGAFIGDNITPINYYNQGYAKRGGSVQQIAQGGLIELAFGGDLGKYIPSVAIINSLMGKLGSDKKSVSPEITNNYYGVGPDGQPIQLGDPMQMHDLVKRPVQMAFGGALGKALGIGGGSGSVSASSQGGPRGSSQGGKGAGFFSEMFNNPEVLALLKRQGQDVGGSQGMDQFAGLTDNPTQQMAGGGMPDMSNIPPEILEQLKAQASAPTTPKAYDQLAALGPNPMQQMQGGGLTGAAEAYGSMMPALQPLLQVASEEALQAVAQPRTYAHGGPFEGRVAGQGDGMSDQVPFNIEGQQPALLSRDEYVVPADVVAMVGDGSSNAGADQFDNFIGDIRTMKYGRQVQPRELNQGLGSLLGVA